MKSSRAESPVAILMSLGSPKKGSLLRQFANRSSLHFGHILSLIPTFPPLGRERKKKTNDPFPSARFSPSPLPPFFCLPFSRPDIEGRRLPSSSSAFAATRPPPPPPPPPPSAEALKEFGRGGGGSRFHVSHSSRLSLAFPGGIRQQLAFILRL